MASARLLPDLSFCQRSLWAQCMPARIRHCVECPKCRTRYLVGLSPYGNGSYVIPTMRHSSEEYTLYCACGKPAVPSRWRWSEIKTYYVSKEAHRRGYGSGEETFPVNRAAFGIGG
jgi:hypothetical protein